MLLTSLLVLFGNTKTASAAVIVELVSTSASYSSPDRRDTGRFQINFNVTAIDGDVYMSSDKFDFWLINSVTNIHAIPESQRFVFVGDLVEAYDNFFKIENASTQSFSIIAHLQTSEIKTSFKGRLDLLRFNDSPTLDNSIQYVLGPEFETKSFVMKGVPEPSISFLFLLGSLGLLRRHR